MIIAVGALPLAVIAAEAQEGDAASDAQTVQKVMILVAATTLLLVLAIMVLAIIRFSRNWRERIERGSESKPTPTSDIWSQHRLPDDVESMLAEDSAESDAEFDTDDDDDEPDRDR